MTLKDFNEHLKKIKIIENRLKILKGILTGAKKEKLHEIQTSFQVNSPYSTTCWFSKKI